MSEVKRYNLMGHRRSDGSLVAFEDFDTLLKERDALKAENEKLELLSKQAGSKGYAQRTLELIFENQSLQEKLRMAKDLFGYTWPDNETFRSVNEFNKNAIKQIESGE